MNQPESFSTLTTKAAAQKQAAELMTRPWYVSAILAVCAVTLLLLGVWGYARSKSAYPYFGTAYDVAAAAFAGQDQNGQPYSFMPKQTGKATALFFGFTHCPNICPLSLTYLNKVRASLPPSQQKQFQIMLVSVDPDRDTTQRLKEYVSFFGQATALRITEPKLAQTAKAYGVGYQKADIKSPTDYQINHTTATYLIDKQGVIRVAWDYTQLAQVDRIKADLQHVLEAH